MIVCPICDRDIIESWDGNDWVYSCDCEKFIRILSEKEVHDLLFPDE